MNPAEQYRAARVARDPRFDGRFFVGVNTTGIFCRPVCKAKLPLEKNVSYILTASQAVEMGYRPCLLCRPDSAPFSFAWQGVDTTVQRAIKLISTDLAQSIEQISERLGVSSRHLSNLFKQKLDTSPKRFQQTQRLLFAKQLLHETQLKVEDVALSSGFNSARRLQASIKDTFNLTPLQIRKNKQATLDSPDYLNVILRLRPPYNWPALRDFFALRQIHTNEIVDEHSFAKCIEVKGVKVIFKATHLSSDNAFDVRFYLNDVTVLRHAILAVRKILDLDAAPDVISAALIKTGLPASQVIEGLRIPGIYNRFEAFTRAVLGQQVSVKAAVGQVNLLNNNLNTPMVEPYEVKDLQPFVTPKQVARADLSFLKMPQARKNSLANIANLLKDEPTADSQACLAIKGIGPWTVNYVELRHSEEPNMFLATDLIIKQRCEHLLKNGIEITPTLASPYQSYLTFNLWNL